MMSTIAPVTALLSAIPSCTPENSLSEMMTGPVSVTSAPYFAFRSELVGDVADRRRRPAAWLERVVVEHRPDFDKVVQVQRPSLALHQRFPGELHRAALGNAVDRVGGQVQRGAMPSSDTNPCLV